MGGVYRMSVEAFAKNFVAFALLEHAKPKFFYSEPPRETVEGCHVDSRFTAEDFDRETKQFVGVVEHVTLAVRDA